MFHNTTSDLQDQDQDRFFWSQTGLVLRPMVSDHIIGSRPIRIGIVQDLVETRASPTRYLAEFGRSR